MLRKFVVLAFISTATILMMIVGPFAFKFSFPDILLPVLVCFGVAYGFEWVLDKVLPRK